MSSARARLRLPRSFPWRILLWTGLTIGYWLLIFGLTHAPGDMSGPVNGHDKLQHAAAFFGLTVLLCAAYNTWRGLNVAGCLMILLVVSCYGALDEVTQQLIRGRFMSLYDWFADLVGACLGVVVGFGWAAFWRSRAAASSAAASAELKTR